MAVYEQDVKFYEIYRCPNCGERVHTEYLRFDKATRELKACTICCPAEQGPVERFEVERSAIRVDPMMPSGHPYFLHNDFDESTGKFYGLYASEPEYSPEQTTVWVELKRVKRTRQVGPWSEWEDA